MSYKELALSTETVCQEIRRYKNTIEVLADMLEQLSDRLEDGVEQASPDMFRGVATLMSLLAQAMGNLAEQLQS